MRCPPRGLMWAGEVVYDSKLEAAAYAAQGKISPPRLPPPGKTGALLKLASIVLFLLFPLVHIQAPAFYELLPAFVSKSSGKCWT